MSQSHGTNKKSGRREVSVCNITLGKKRKNLDNCTHVSLHRTDIRSSKQECKTQVFDRKEHGQQEVNSKASKTNGGSDDEVFVPDVKLGNIIGDKKEVNLRPSADKISNNAECDYNSSEITKIKEHECENLGCIADSNKVVFRLPEEADIKQSDTNVQHEDYSQTQSQDKDVKTVQSTLLISSANSAKKCDYSHQDNSKSNYDAIKEKTLDFGKYVDTSRKYSRNYENRHYRYYDGGMNSPMMKEEADQEDVPVIVRRRGCTLRVRITSYPDFDSSLYGESATSRAGFLHVSINSFSL